MVMVLVMCKGEHHKLSLPTAFYHPKDAYKQPPYAPHPTPSHHEHHHHHAHHEDPTSPPSYAYEHPTTPSYGYNQASYPNQYQTAEEPSYHGSSSEYGHAEVALRRPNFHQGGIGREQAAVHHAFCAWAQCSMAHSCTCSRQLVFSACFLS